MTIALGILATDGVVLAADRQVTVPNYLKMDEGKISLCGKVFPPPAGPVELLITGSGSATSITHLRQSLTEAFGRPESLRSLSDFGPELDRQIKAFHHEHVVPDGSGNLAVSMIVGGMDRLSKRLWVTDRSIVNEEKEFAAIGAGETYAKILMARLCGRMDTTGAMLLAAYVIHEVKNVIDGCGSDTDVYTISRTKPCLMDPRSARKLDDIFDRCSQLNRDVIYDVFGDHIDWYGQQRRSISRETKKLRREVVEIMRQVEALPDWAQASTSSSSNSSQT